MKSKFKYMILIIVPIIILILIINVLLNAEKKLEPLSSQIENVRVIDEYDFTTMGKSSFDKIYEKYDIVQFGHYMQDKKGKKKTPIDWIVLDKKDDKVLLFSKYILDLDYYHNKNQEISWAECSLRKWLNDEFYNTAFSNEEKKQIIEITNKNEDYKDSRFYDTKDREDTIDKVFLLSQDEINMYFENGGIYDSKIYKESEIEEYGVYVPSVDNATTKATDYVINKYMEYYGIVDKEELEDALNYAFHKDKGSVFDYWLRNFAKSSSEDDRNNKNRAAIVDYMGYLSTSPILGYDFQGVRPAIWVSLE